MPAPKSRKPKTAPKWIRGEADRLALAEGCYFDADAGQHACDFVEQFCRQSQGRWGGELIVLMDWQRDFLMRLFGWKQANGLRRFRRAYLEIAKKNGKSTLVSALVLYLLVADGERGPKVFINAVDREQAKLVYDEAALMVESSPELAEIISVVRSKNNITCASNNGVLRANSAEVASKDGANASAWVFDEIHRQPNRDMYDIFRYAGSAREQPLEITITTAGEEEAGIWFDLREYSEAVNAGTLPDTSHLGVVYRADPADDIDDPATWYKANPSLGVTLTERDFKNDLEEAKRSPSALANFLRLKLGIIANAAAKFFDMKAWDACATPPESPSGRTGYAGLDLSSIRDLTGWSVVVPDDDGEADLFVRCWIPEEAAVEKERMDRVPYRMWKEAGFIEFTPGAGIDYAFIEKAIVEDVERFNIKTIFADPWNAEDLCQRLIARGINVVYLRQGWSLNGPTKATETLVLRRKLRHGGHPVLRWCISNAIPTYDENENVRLSKKKSRQRIDLASATVNAIGAWKGEDPEDAEPSVYEKRGIVYL